MGRGWGMCSRGRVDDGILGKLVNRRRGEHKAEEKNRPLRNRKDAPPAGTGAAALGIESPEKKKRHGRGSQVLKNRDIEESG